VRKKLAALVVAAFAVAVLAAPGETVASPGTAPLAGIDDAARCRSYLAYGRITAPGRCNYATSAQMMRSLLTRDRAPFDALLANRDANQRWATAGSNELAIATVASTARVSVGGAGNEANDYSCCPSMSADGRSVAFESYATNLVPTDTNNRLDIFVRDTSLATTTRASLDSGGNQANDDSYVPVMSADGRFVAFVGLRRGKPDEGRTAAEGVVGDIYTIGRLRVLHLRFHQSPPRTAHTRTGSPTPLSACSPRSSKRTTADVRARERTVSETNISPGAASPAMREAMLTAPP
jgi:hypothetical protein